MLGCVHQQHECYCFPGVLVHTHTQGEEGESGHDNLIVGVLWVCVSALQLDSS